MKKKNGKGNNNHKNNSHHIFPINRFPELKDVGWNKTSVDEKKHAIYHWLFDDRSPLEIFQKITNLFPIYIAAIILFYLNNDFWGELFIFETKKNKLRSIRLKNKYRQEFKEKAKNHQRTLKHV